MNRFILSVFVLSVIYCMFLLSAQVWDLATGAVISTAVILLFRRHLFGSTWEPITRFGQRAVALLPFAWYVLADTARGFWTVTIFVLGLRPLSRSGIVAVPIGKRTANGVAVTAWATTLSPGSVLIDVDWDRQVMLFHFIDATDPDELRKTIQDSYDRYQKKVFP